MHAVELFGAVFVGLHGSCGGEWGTVGVIVGALHHDDVLAHYAANVALIILDIVVQVAE